MAALIYTANMSLDGYMEDADGRFDWTDPSDEVFADHIERERALGTTLYGRRMYEAMAVWETDPSMAARSPAMREFTEVWQDADKVVYSTTLEKPSTERTRIERRFDPEAVRRLKETASADILVAGATLAAHAFAAGLVDVCDIYVLPVTVRAGKPALPARLSLELFEQRRFDNGTVRLRYRVTG